MKKHRTKSMMLVISIVSFLVLTSIIPIVSAGSIPDYSNEQPTDGSSTHDNPVTLSIYIDDPDGDTVEVEFRDDSDDSLIGVDYVYGTGTASTTWNLGSPSDGNSFSWFICIDDGEYDVCSSSIWHFSYINNNPSYSNEQPSDGSITSDTTVTLEIDIIDSDGDSVAVAFYDDSDNSQIGNDIVSGGSGTASTTWNHGASDGETLSWYISVNDDHGSGNLYSFPIWDFTYTSLNIDPIACFDYSISGLDVNVDAGCSTDSDGTITTWWWDWTNDGGWDDTTSGETASHTYPAAGPYTCKLRVFDNDGGWDDDTGSFTLSGGGTNEDPVASFTYSTNGLTVSVDGSGSSDPDGTITGYQWDWTTDGSYDDTGETASHTYTSNGTYNVTLRVMDNGSATNTTMHQVTVTTGGSSSSGFATDNTMTYIIIAVVAAIAIGAVIYFGPTMKKGGRKKK